MEKRVGRTRSHVGRRVGHVGRCSPRTRGEEPSKRFERKKVTGDESTPHSDGRIGNRTLQQVCEASPCCAKIWVKQGEPTDGVQARNSCKHTVRHNIHQRKNHKAN